MIHALRLPYRDDRGLHQQGCIGFRDSPLVFSGIRGSVVGVPIKRAPVYGEVYGKQQIKLPQDFERGFRSGVQVSMRICITWLCGKQQKWAPYEWLHRVTWDLGKSCNNLDLMNGGMSEHSSYDNKAMSLITPEQLLHSTS